MRIEYTDEIKHSYYTNVKSGNPYRNKDGTFGFGPKRYVYEGQGPNPDGSSGTHYTKAGRERYEQERLKNLSKKSSSRMDEEAVGDVNRWVKDDINNVTELAKSAQTVGKQISSTADMFKYKKRRGRIDLSQMSDAELREILNREMMERQYNDYFNAPQVNKGAQFAKGAGDVITFLGTTGLTALQIVNAINELRG